MRMQRHHVVLEPDSEHSFDSEDDFKEFGDAYQIFKAEFNELIEDDKHFARDPQYLKLFRGVLELDALDP